MIPIRDTIRSRSFPFVNWAIILLNGLIFFYQSSLSQTQLDAFIETFALIPANIELTNPLTWYPILTHTWLHASLVHIISNLWILLIFGDNVEDRLGSKRYLLFYLLGGISAGLLQLFFLCQLDRSGVGRQRRYRRRDGRLSDLLSALEGGDFCAYFLFRLVCAHFFLCVYRRLVPDPDVQRLILIWVRPRPWSRAAWPGGRTSADSCLDC